MMAMKHCKYKHVVFTIASLFLLFDLQVEVQKCMSHILSYIRKALLMMYMQVSLDWLKSCLEFIIHNIILSLHSFLGTKKTYNLN